MAERYESELVLDAHAQVGEGPIWEPRDRALIWVDILRNEVHQLDPASRQDRRWDVGQSVGAAVLFGADDSYIGQLLRGRLHGHLG